MNKEKEDWLDEKAEHASECEMESYDQDQERDREEKQANGWSN